MTRAIALPAGMHEAESMAALGFTDHDDDSAEAGPVYNLEPVCTCSTTRIGGAVCLQCDPGCRAQKHNFDWRQK